MIKKIIRLNSNPVGFGETPDELTRDMFASPLPVQNSYEYYSDKEAGLYVGVWDTSKMIEAAGPYPCDEYMLLLEGKTEIKNNKTAEMEKVQAGEAFVIPRGYDCQWHQSGYLRKYFFIYEHPDVPIPDEPATEGIVILDSKKPVLNVSIPDPFLVPEPARSSILCQYQDTSHRFYAGIWECGTFQSTVNPLPYHLFTYVMDGSITLFDEDDKQHSFKPLDAFFISKGTLCRARAIENIKISFAILC